MTEIYADNAATTKVSPNVIKSMIPYFEQIYGNPSSRHKLSKEPTMALVNSRKIISECINADPDEIYFTSGGTESDNWALRGVVNGKKNHIITTSIEHSAILETCNFLKKHGINVTYLKVDSEGNVDLKELKESINAKTAIVSIMHGNNEIGTLQNLEAISEIVHEHDCLFHTDAVQTIGHIPIDVKKMGIDLLSASAHKFNGPRGVGFLYVKNGISINPLIYGGHQQHNMRSGTENVPGIIGMAVALRDNCSSIIKNMKYLKKLEALFKKQFHDFNVDHVFNGNPEYKIPGLISVSFKNISAEAVVDLLSIKNIYVSAGSACNSHSVEVSHVLESLSLPAEYSKGTIRISLNYSNDESDVLRICDELKTIVRSLRHLSV